MKVFLCGDYEFLCNMYGLSGASGISIQVVGELHSYILILGRHCCLWCLIKQDQLKLSPAVRPAIQLRTISSILADNQRFVDAGSNPKNVKHFNNCLLEPLLTNFPLTQVHILYIQYIEQCAKIHSYRCVLLDFTYPWASS